MQQSIILQPSQRLEYIDLAKGIGIMLVVIGHCVDGQGFLGQYIWSYHMPLFFMISGLCFNDNRYPTFKSFLQKRVKTLFIPCLYFTAIMLILSTLVLPSYYDLSLIRSKFPSAYWFVFTLFLSELFFYESNRIFKTQTMKIIFLFICLGISALLMWIELELPYNICSVFIATFFYGLGFMMKKMFNNMAINIGRGGVIALFLLIIPAVSVYFTKLSIDLSSNTIPFPMIYYILIALDCWNIDSIQYFLEECE